MNEAATRSKNELHAHFPEASGAQDVLRWNSFSTVAFPALYWELLKGRRLALSSPNPQHSPRAQDKLGPTPLNLGQLVTALTGKAQEKRCP